MKKQRVEKEESEVTMASLDRTPVFEGQLPVGQIEVAKNFRRTFDPKKLAELAADIRRHGIIHPLLLRAKGDGSVYVVVAGERRFRAAEEIGLETVPVRAFLMTDLEAAEIQAMENLHRADLSPIEEARSFKALIDLTKQKAGSESESIRALAERVDKSESYVFRSVKLLELPHEIVDAIDSGRLTAAHGLQLLRATKDAMPALVKEVMRKDTPTAKELRDTIDRQVARDLSAAPFPKDMPFAGEIACVACPRNTGNQGSLFDGASKGLCTGPACYEKKMTVERDMFRVELTAKYSGMEFLGVKEDVYDLMRKDRTLIKLDDWSHLKTAAVLKAMKAAPERFAFALSIGGRYNRHLRQEVFFCRSRAFLNQLMPKQQRDSGASGGPTAKQRFVMGKVTDALIAAVIERVDGDASMTEILGAVIPMQRSGSDCAAVRRAWPDMPKWSVAALEKKKIKVGDLMKIAALGAVMQWGSFHDQSAKLLGVDVAGVRKRAAKAAAKEYDAKKKGGKKAATIKKKK